jgi:hypothetical protein
MRLGFVFLLIYKYLGFLSIVKVLSKTYNLREIFMIPGKKKSHLSRQDVI